MGRLGDTDGLWTWMGRPGKVGGLRLDTGLCEASAR